MTDIIERAARAMAAEGVKFIEPWNKDNFWDGFLTEKQKEAFRAKARAVLQAIREPSKEMLEVGGGAKGLKTRLWHAMIDTALGDHQ